MTRKAPAGKAHARCLDHVPHGYTSTGWLCITTSEPDRAADMAAFADYLTIVRADHSAAESARRAASPSLTTADYLQPLETMPDGRPVYRSVCRETVKGGGCKVPSATHHTHERSGSADPATWARSSLNDCLIPHRCAYMPDGRTAVRAKYLDAGGRCVACAWSPTARPAVETGTNAYGRTEYAQLIGPYIAEMDERPTLPADAFTPRDVAADARVASFETGTKIGRRVAAARKARPVAEPVAVEPIAEPEPIASACYTCGAPVGRHDAYCESCIAAQLVANGGTEREAVETYHELVDAVAGPVAPDPEPIADPVADPVVTGSHGPTHTLGDGGHCLTCEARSPRPAEPVAESDPGYTERVAAAQAQNRADMLAHVAESDPELRAWLAARQNRPEPVAEPVQPEPAMHARAYPEPEPVAEPVGPIMAAVPEPERPAERPTCPRCGQVFRKSGNGRAWHIANRPDCAAGRPALAVAQ